MCTHAGPTAFYCDASIQGIIFNIVEAARKDMYIPMSNCAQNTKQPQSWSVEADPISRTVSGDPIYNYLCIPICSFAWDQDIDNYIDDN